MKFDISSEKLARLASDPSYSGGYSTDVVDMFRQTLQIVAAVPDESAIREFQCLRYSKLRRRGSRRRIALTNGASLVVRIQNGKKDSKVIVERIDQNGRKK